MIALLLPIQRILLVGVLNLILTNLQSSNIDENEPAPGYPEKKVSEMKGINVICAVVMVLACIGLVSAQETCEKNTYYLSRGYVFAQENLLFNHLDLDLGVGGIQEDAIKRPGEKVTGEVSWQWGEVCPDCTVHISVFGSWTEEEIALIYSGSKGERVATATVPFSFEAPQAPGEHVVRVIFAYDVESPSDFWASNLCSSGQCQKSGECSVLIAEARLNITSSATLPPRVKLTSPGPLDISDSIEIKHGQQVPINAVIDDPNATVTIWIGGENVSTQIPFTWDTSNFSLGPHEIVLEVGNPYGSIDEYIYVTLTDPALEVGTRPTPLWSMTLDEGIKSAVVTSEGKVIASLPASVVAFNDQGQREWKFELPSGTSSLAISPSGTMIVLASGSTIFVLSPDGTVIWNTSVVDAMNRLAISDNGRVAAASGNNVYNLDGDGTLRWSTTLSYLVDVSIFPTGELAAIAGDEVYLLDDNGTISWTYPLSNITDLLAIEEAILVNSQDALVILTKGGGLEKRIPLKGTLTDFFYSGDILILDNNSVTDYSRTGEVEWRYPFDGDEIAASGGYVLLRKDRTLFFSTTLPIAKAQQTGEMNKYILPAGLIVALVLMGAVLFKLRSRKRKQKETVPKPSFGVIEEEKHVDKGKIIVKAINSMNRQPVSGVEIVLGEERMVTDGKGEAVFEDLSMGQHTIEVLGASYNPYRSALSVRWEEEFVEVSLSPMTVVPPALQDELVGIRGTMEASFAKVSSYDTCIPHYLKDVGDVLISAVEESAQSPELYGEGEQINDTTGALLLVLQDVAGGMCQVMTDWKNVRLFQQAGVLEPARCHPKRVDTGDIKDVLSNPAGYKGSNMVKVEGELKLVDSDINRKMGELTILPVAGLWGVAKKLMDGAQESGVKGSFSIFAAGIILEYCTEMLVSDEIVERLRFSFL